MGKNKIIAVEDSEGLIYCTKCMPEESCQDEKSFPVLHVSTLVKQYPTIRCHTCNKRIAKKRRQV